MRMLLARCAGLGLLLLLSMVPISSAQNLSLTLATEIPTSGTINTRSPQQQSLLVSSGHRVSLTRATGRDYRLEASGGFFWTQVQEIPRDGEYLSFLPTVGEDGSIEVQIEQRRKVGTRLDSFSSTVLVQPGEWQQLVAPATQAPRGTTVYGTQALGPDALYLRVDY